MLARKRQTVALLLLLSSRVYLITYQKNMLFWQKMMFNENLVLRLAKCCDTILNLITLFILVWHLLKIDFGCIFLHYSVCCMCFCIILCVFYHLIFGSYVLFRAY